MNREELKLALKEAFEAGMELEASNYAYVEYGDPGHELPKYEDFEEWFEQRYPQS